MFKKASLISLILLSTMFVLNTYAAHQELAVFGINEFDSECGGGDLNYSDEFVDKVRDQFEDRGWWTFRRFNAGVDGRDWADSSKSTWGNDASSEGVDHADVGLLSTHGGSDSDSSWYVMGDDHSGPDDTGTSECSPDTQFDIIFGNGSGDLEVVILAACQTAQKGVWDNTGYFHARDRYGKLNTWLGFHGNSYDSNADSNRIKKFAKNSFFNGLGDNWLDEMYWDPSGSNNTQCPTAIIFCENTSDCDRQFDYGGFDDRFKVTNSDVKSWSTYYYLKNCNPASGSKL